MKLPAENFSLAERLMFDLRKKEYIKVVPMLTVNNAYGRRNSINVAEFMNHAKVLDNGIKSLAFLTAYAEEGERLSVFSQIKRTLEENEINTFGEVMEVEANFYAKAEELFKSRTFPKETVQAIAFESR